MNNTKLIYKHAKGIRLKMLIGSLLLVISSFSSMIAIALEKDMLDSLAALNVSELKMQIIYYFIIAIAIFIAGVAGSYFLLRVNTTFRLKQYENLIRKIYTLNIQKFKSIRAGTFLNYFMTDIPNVSMIYIYIIPEIVLELFTIIYIAYYFVRIYIYFFICGILFVVLSQLINYVFINHIQAINGQLSKMRAFIMIRLEEGIEAYDEIVIYNNKNWFLKKIDETLQQFYSIVKKEANISNLASFFGEILKWSPQILVLFISGVGMMNGKYSVGVVYLVYRYMKQLMEYSNTIYGVILDLNRRSVYLKRLELFMNSSSEKKDSGFVFHEKIRTIEYRDVSFQYQMNHSKVKNVIDKWNCSINEGESTAFIGMSGSGKSTLLQLLMKLYEPNSGNIYINGISLKQIDIKSWLAQLAVVMQEPYIFHDTIRNNIIMNQGAISDEYIIEICKLVCIWNFIKSKSGGLDYCLEAKGKNISGGQIQRIALARALIRDPQILILDEATSALDIETERNVLNKILKYREGKTTLMIAHRKEAIEKNKNIVSLT